MEIFNGSDDSSTGTEHNNAIEYINKLNVELNEALRNKELALLEVERLIDQISAKEAKKKSIERSLAESQNIAAEIENIAYIKSRAIMADAEAVVTSWQAQLVLIEQEIAAIQEELEPDVHLTKNTSEPAHNPGYVVVDISPPEVIEMDSSQSCLDDNAGEAILIPPQVIPVDNTQNLSEEIYSEKTPARTLKIAVRKERPQKNHGDNALYNMQLVAFVNARHFVTFGGKDGPVHAHSWQAQIEVQVPAEKGEVMGFAKISSAITDALSPYENTILNYVHPFNKIQPTTENIAMYFYNCLEDGLVPLGLSLAMMTLWETPTRGIQVTSRNVSFDGLLQVEEDAEQTALEMAAMREQAAVADIAFKERISHMFEMVKVKRPLNLSTEWAEGPLRPPYSFGNYALAFILISLAAFMVYYSILFPPFDQRFPWGSDTWGHLFKADYLYHEILKGNYYPQFTEYWYNGTQPFRYWAPLPYYVLALMEAITGDIFTAGSLFVFICALVGGTSWLLLARWMGIWPAAMAGIIWVLWQDNVRVALSEGNIPRILATALLPLLFVAFLRTMGKHKSFMPLITTVILIHAIVLSHAMIGAVYCVCLFFFAFFLFVFNGCRGKDFILSMLLLIVGIATTAWWLLPSLTGGITGLDVDAVKEAIQFIPANISLNPFLRSSYPENFYWGTSVLVALAVTFVTWPSKPAWAKSLGICGVILIIITFPIIKAVYIIMPLSHLMWPLRFTTFAILAILASALTFKTQEYRQPLLKTPYLTGIILFCIFSTMLVDSLFSLRVLVHTSSNHYDVLQSAQTLKKESGWRVATIDLSQLGSAPSYAFSQAAGLEQVFGWAWQGAVTSRNIMLLNTGLENQYYSFLFRSCIDLGATDLVVKDDVVKKPEAFWAAAQLAGYKYQQTFKGLSLWHSLDQPYMVAKKRECLVIGRYGGTIALQFSGVEMGFSNEIDQYSLSDLKQYSKIILSGAKWSSKIKAEKLIADYLDSGGQLIVELSGMPENVLAKQPEFLGVYGEPVTMRGQFVIKGKDKSYELEPIPVDAEIWRAFVPMGLDQVEMEFDYYGNQAPVYGYKLVNGKKVWFIGSNLTYHSFMTGDPMALQLLKEMLGMNVGYEKPQIIPLQNYHASESGYTMDYQMDNAVEAIIPVAAIEGMKVTVDGAIIPAGKYENLLRVELPAGFHQIDIRMEKTPVYRWGMLLSLFALMALLAITLYMTRYMNRKNTPKAEVAA